MILRGIKEAAFINTVATIAKIVPILVFVLFMALAFDSELFRASFWGGGAYTAGDVFNQVRSTMLGHRVRVHRGRGRQRLLPLRQDPS
jgi:arginine:ornithine antiporter / lysine permease